MTMRLHLSQNILWNIFAAKALLTLVLGGPDAILLHQTRTTPLYLLGLVRNVARARVYIQPLEISSYIDDSVP
jgi:hypothetical protein